MAKRDTDLGEQYGTEKDEAYDKLKGAQENSEKAKKVLRGAGYARGGGVSPAKREKHPDEKEDKALIKHMLSKAKIKAKHGGKISGKKPHQRADKYKRGGSVPRGHTKININVGSGAAQEEKKQALKAGMMLGARMAGGPRPAAGAPMQARPVGGAAPASAPNAPMGGMPPGGAPMPPGAKRGGRTYKRGGPVRIAGIPHLKGGSGGAEGRLSKIASYGTKPKA